jgi:hypothetical protein
LGRWQAQEGCWQRCHGRFAGKIPGNVFGCLLSYFSCYLTIQTFIDLFMGKATIL